MNASPLITSVVATTYGREGQQALQRTPDDVRVILGV